MTQSVARRVKNLNVLAIFFAEHGPMTSAEYASHPERPLTPTALRSVFRSYSRAIRMLERNEPELWAIANGTSTAPDTSKIEAALKAAESGTSSESEESSSYDDEVEDEFES